MIYYKATRQHEQRVLNKYYTVCENELLTEKEIKRKHFTFNNFTVIEIPKNKTIKMFGVRKERRT